MSRTTRAWEGGNGEYRFRRRLRPAISRFTNGGGHVMLVASRTTAIAAPRTGTRVRCVPLTQIRDEFVAGRRLLAG